MVQLAALADYAKGKTVEELKTMAVGEDGKAGDVDLAAPTVTATSRISLWATPSPSAEASLLLPRPGITASPVWLALSLEFKMAAEILKTVLVRDMTELMVLGAVIILRALLSFLIHFEMKQHDTSNHARSCWGRWWWDRWSARRRC